VNVMNEGTRECFTFRDSSWLFPQNGLFDGICTSRKARLGRLKWTIVIETCGCDGPMGLGCSVEKAEALFCGGLEKI